jgi:hypothetical protein
MIQIIIETGWSGGLVEPGSEKLMDPVF